MAETTPDKKRPWLLRIRSRVHRLMTVTATRFAEWRFGPLADQRKAILSQLRKIPGGKAALKAANDNEAVISVVPGYVIDGAKGRFSPRKKKPLVRISATKDIARMVSTLWHELRHLRQHLDWGDMGHAGTTMLLDTPRYHMTRLMCEADSYTAQTLMCLHQKKAGKPEYLDAFLARNSPACVYIKSFLEKRPYESFTDDAAFSRTLFAGVVKHGLPGYHAKYLAAYRKGIKQLKNTNDLRKFLANKKPKPELLPSNELLQIYGQRNDNVTTLRPLAQMFLNDEPRELRDTLALIDATTAKAATLTEAEFKAARREILTRTKTLSKQFTKTAGEIRASAVKKPVPRLHR
jgi:hypothetical protein